MPRYIILVWEGEPPCYFVVDTTAFMHGHAALIGTFYDRAAAKRERERLEGE